MTGHFMFDGTPEELNVKSYGDGTKELAEFKFGYQRFKTFSATVIQILRTSDKVRVAGEVKENHGKEGTPNEGKVFSDFLVAAAWPLAKKAEPQPEGVEGDLPF